MNKDYTPIARQLKKRIAEHERTLRENYKKMITRYSRIRKRIST